MRAVHVLRQCIRSLQQPQYVALRWHRCSHTIDITAIDTSQFVYMANTIVELLVVVVVVVG